MSRKHQDKQGALLGGLFLIALGFLFLLSNWLPYWSFGEMIARYWPVILILIGVQSLYRYFAYTPSEPPIVTSSPPPPPPITPSLSQPGYPPNTGGSGTNAPPER